MNLLKLSLLTLCLTSPAFAFDDSYQGNLVLCPGQRPVTLDYFDAALPVLDANGPNVVKLQGWSQAQVIEFALSRLEGTLYKAQLERALESVGTVNRWIATDLKETSRYWGKFELPGDCKRVQGSARISNVQYIDPLYARGLDRAQLGILQLHEAVAAVGEYYRGYSYERPEPGLFQRELIRRILNLDYDSYDIAEAIRALGHKALQLEVLFGEGGRIRPNTIGVSSSSTFEDRRDCHLTVRDMNWKGEGSLSYSSGGSGTFKDERFCSHTNRVRIQCSPDATHCEVTGGEMPGNEKGWVKGCKIEIGELTDKGSLWKLTCPGSTRTWSFRF